MRTSQNGIDLIKSFEGCVLHAYKPVPTEKYYTIGYGHYGSDVNPWDQITPSVAEQLLARDLQKYENKVNQYNYIYNFNQNEFDACVSFTYNCGVGNFDKLVNYGKRSRDEIRTAWLKYNKAGGKELKGLTARRQKELELFNTYIPQQTTDSPVPVINTNVREVTAFVAADYIIKATSLRIREGIGTEYKQVGSVKCNEIVHVLVLYTNNINEIWGKIDDNKYICIEQNNKQYALINLARNIVEYSLQKDGDKYLAKNFKVKEFKCKDGSDKILIDHYLVYFLQLIRNHFNKAVNINSGYRTDSYNKKVGGATHSQHLQGAAADIHINGVTPLQIAQFAEFINMKGIGLYTTFTHVDTRSNKSFWQSSNQYKINSFN